MLYFITIIFTFLFFIFIFFAELLIFFLQYNLILECEQEPVNYIHCPTPTGLKEDSKFLAYESAVRSLHLVPAAKQQNRSGGTLRVHAVGGDDFR